jgi:hypothetical protein
VANRRPDLEMHSFLDPRTTVINELLADEAQGALPHGIHGLAREASRLEPPRLNSQASRRWPVESAKLSWGPPPRLVCVAAFVLRSARWPCAVQWRCSEAARVLLHALVRSCLPDSITMKRWFLEHPDHQDDAKTQSWGAESEDHLFAASLAAATALALFALVMVFALGIFAFQVAAAWIALG